MVWTSCGRRCAHCGPEPRGIDAAVAMGGSDAPMSAADLYNELLVNAIFADPGAMDALHSLQATNATSSPDVATVVPTVPAGSGLRGPAHVAHAAVPGASPSSSRKGSCTQDRPVRLVSAHACMGGAGARAQHGTARVHQAPTCNSSRRMRSQPSVRTQYCAHARMVVRSQLAAAIARAKARANLSSHTHSLAYRCRRLSGLGLKAATAAAAAAAVAVTSAAATKAR